MKKRANLLRALGFVLSLAMLGLGVYLFNYVNLLTGRILVLIGAGCFIMLLLERLVSMAHDIDRNDRGGGRLPPNMGGRGLWG